MLTQPMKMIIFNDIYAFMTPFIILNEIYIQLALCRLPTVKKNKISLVENLVVFKKTDCFDSGTEVV